jgi:hypothetical protein
LNEIESIYTKNLAREYRQAFDYAASLLVPGNGKTLCVLSSNVYAVELIKRIPTPLCLTGVNGFDAAGFISRASAWAWGDLESGAIDGSAEKFEAILWAAPESGQYEFISHQLHHRATPGTRLIIVVRGLLHRFIPYPGSMLNNNLELLLPYFLLNSLQKTGWHIEYKLGFHGPRSIFWSCIHHLYSRSGRQDWADQALFSIRNSYLEAGMFWWLSPLLLIRAGAI